MLRVNKTLVLSASSGRARILFVEEEACSAITGSATIRSRASKCQKNVTPMEVGRAQKRDPEHEIRLPLNADPNPRFVSAFRTQ